MKLQVLKPTKDRKHWYLFIIMKGVDTHKALQKIQRLEIILLYNNGLNLLGGNVKYPFGVGSQHLATVSVMGLQTIIMQ